MAKRRRVGIWKARAFFGGRAFISRPLDGDSFGRSDWQGFGLVLLGLEELFGLLDAGGGGIFVHYFRIGILLGCHLLDFCLFLSFDVSEICKEGTEVDELLFFFRVFWGGLGFGGHNFFFFCCWPFVRNSWILTIGLF